MSEEDVGREMENNRGRQMVENKMLKPRAIWLNAVE